MYASVDGAVIWVSRLYPNQHTSREKTNYECVPQVTNRLLKVTGRKCAVRPLLPQSEGM